MFADFLPSLPPSAWTLVLVAAFFTGMSKAGLAGISMLGVTLTALAMDGMASTGVVLPLLIFADLMAVSTFRKDIQWQQIRRLGWPILGGLVLGWLAMMHLGGLGVPKSTDEALNVFRRAAAIGYQPAIRMLASLGQPWCE